jgi:hypothetical protein
MTMDRMIIGIKPTTYHVELRVHQIVDTSHNKLYVI